MQFHVLRESPDNSGQFNATGEVFDGTVVAAVQRTLDLIVATSSRHAVQPYEAVRNAPPLPDMPEPEVEPVEPAPDLVAAAVAAVSAPETPAAPDAPAHTNGA